MNEFAPQHSKLFKEVCHFSPYPLAIFFGRVASVCMIRYLFLPPKLFEQMILVSSPTRPFALTAKLTARRQAVIAEYESEIDALYDAVNETAQAVKYFPNEWTEQSSLEFARNLIGSVLKVPVKDDDDIFQYSCDRFRPSTSDPDPSH
jgi:hypothetical protein